MKLKRALAQSEHYTIQNEYETVLLYRDEHPPLRIGDFYGDPQTALIDWNEQWCIMGGCGLILYRLHESFLPYTYDKENGQWIEFDRKDPYVWWIETIYQVGDDTVRFVVDPCSNTGGLYELNTSTLAISPLIFR